MSTADMICPHCNASMRGDEIPAKYRVHKDDCADQVDRFGRCYCLSFGDATHFSRVMGHEVRGVYDGVLFWSCPDCGVAWPRFDDGGRLSSESARFVAMHNAEREGAA